MGSKSPDAAAAAARAVRAKGAVVVPVPPFARGKDALSLRVGDVGA